jgi:hypothetical protein
LEIHIAFPSLILHHASQSGWIINGIYRMLPTNTERRMS